MARQLIDLHRIHECRSYWQQALARAPATHPLLSGEFLLEAAQRFGSRTLKRYLVLNRVAERCDWAFIAERVRFGAWRTFSIAQLPLAPFVVSATPAKPLSASAVFRALPGLAWTIMVKDHDPAYSSSALLELRDCTDIFETHVAVCIEVAGSFEDYWSTRSKNLRRSIRTCVQKVEAEGFTISLHVLSAADEIEAAIKTHGEIEATGWKSASGNPLGRDGNEAKFYRDVLMRSAATGNARIYQLRFGEQTVASQLVLIEGTTMALLKTGYQDNFSRFAPGRLLDYFMLQSLFAESRIERIEYCTIASDDDVRWATSVRPIAEIHLYRWPFVRTLVRRLRDIKQRLRKHIVS